VEILGYSVGGVKAVFEKHTKRSEEELHNGDEYEGPRRINLP